MRTVNLYGESGITIYLDNYNDIVDAPHVGDPSDAAVAVIGHCVYACSLVDAQAAIRRDYLARER
jgi:hypothetical protein